MSAGDQQPCNSRGRSRTVHDHTLERRAGGGAKFESSFTNGFGAVVANLLVPALCLCPAARVFDRRWANTVLQQALDRLRQEHVAAGKEILFDVLADGLTGAAPSQPYAELAMKLSMTEAAVKMAIHRLRKRYGELLRLEVAQTV